MDKNLVTNIQKFSVHDGPGIRSIVFFKGCPLSCKWCSNPENIHIEPELVYYPIKCISCGFCQDACSEGANAIIDGSLVFDKGKCVNCCKCAQVCCAKAREIMGREYTIEELIKELDKDVPFYKKSGGGITYSGGEPLLHPEIIAQISPHYQEQGITSAVETCGYVAWENIEQTLSVIDLFLFDLKFVDSQKHIDYCGQSNKLILDNLTKLCAIKDVIVRMPIIPGINDTEKDLELAGEFLKEISQDIEYVNCLPYHNLGTAKYDALGIKYELSALKAPTGERMQEIKRQLETYGLSVKIGG